MGAGAHAHLINSGSIKVGYLDWWTQSVDPKCDLATQSQASPESGHAEGKKESQGKMSKSVKLN